jgi:hypothetical protein
MCSDFIAAEEAEGSRTMGHWASNIMPAVNVPVATTGGNGRKIDPCPGIFQHIAALAAATSPFHRSPPPPGPPSSLSGDAGRATPEVIMANPDADAIAGDAGSGAAEEAPEDSNSESGTSSGWESEGSMEVGMVVEGLPLDVHASGATFSSS